MPIAFRYAAHSDTGRVRGKNDDSAYAGRYLAVLADGMGGHVGGNVASASTVLDLTPLDHNGFNGSAGTFLADEIQTANQILNQLVELNPLLAGMGTTCTALLVDGDVLELAHIGDSRAYRLRHGELTQISTDHTFVQRLVDEGRITAAEAETHPHKNVIMRVLGDTDASPELQLEQLETEVGDRYLLCSDGLTDVVDDRTIGAVLGSTDDLQSVCDDLVQLTLERGAPDNVTVAVVEVVQEQDLARADTHRLDVVPAHPEENGTAQPQDGTTAPTSQDSAEAPDASPEAEAPAPGRNIAPWRRRIHREDSTAPLRHTLRTGKWRGESFSDGVLNAMTERAGIDVAPPAEEQASSASVLRRELAERPHLLVGAASAATHTGAIPTVTDSTVQRRATLVSSEEAASARTEELPEDVVEQLSARSGRRRRWGFTLFMWLFVLVLLVGAAWAALAWINHQYYVGESNGKVAVYQGVPQSVGPVHFSELKEETDIRVADLPDFSRSRVENTIHASSEHEARQVVQDVRLGQKEESEPSASPSGASPSGPSHRGPSHRASSSPTAGDHR